MNLEIVSYRAEGFFHLDVSLFSFLVWMVVFWSEEAVTVWFCPGLKYKLKPLAQIFSK